MSTGALGLPYRHAVPGPLTIHAETLFDGQHFATDATVSVADGRIISITTGGATTGADRHVPCLLPGLIDGAVRLRGYREAATDLPFAAIDRIAGLLARYGVAGIKESGNSREALAYALDMIDMTGVAASGPVLTSTVPVHEVEHPVTTPARARAAVESIGRDGGDWIMLGAGLAPDGARAACEAAAQLGLPVAAVPGATSVVELAGLGVRCLHGAHHLLSHLEPWDGDLPPAQVALRWAKVPKDRLEEEIMPTLLDRDVTLAPELVSFRRMVLIREAIEAPGLEDLVGIFPATRWLLEMRRAGGFTLGRRQLAGATGLTDLGRHERRQAEQGLDRLTGFVRAAVAAGVPLVPASRTPGFGMVPGLGLMEELSLTALDLGLGIEGALRAATSGAADKIGLTELGRLGPGSPSVLAVADDPASGPHRFFGSVRSFHPVEAPSATLHAS